MDSQAKKLKKLLEKLEGPSLDEDDLKSMALAIISDIEGTSAYHAKARIEALRLLKDIVIKEKAKDSDMNNDSIMALLGGKSKNEKKSKEFD